MVLAMAVNKFCDDCWYCCKLADGLRCCNYLLKTNHRRPCPPGEGCTVKIKRKVYRRRKKNAED
jgi:hypothetical protein